MRRSGLTSKFVCVVLETSMFFSGEWFFSWRAKFHSGFNVWRYMKFPDMDKKSFIASPAFGNESWGGGRDPSDSPRKSMWLSPWIGRRRTKVDVLRSWSKGFDSSICDRKYEFSFFLRKYHLFRIESFWVDFRCVHRLQLLKVCDQYVTLPNSPAYNAYPRNNPGETFFPNWWILDWSFAEIG